MLDGGETVEIAWGELRWEGARQHAGLRGFDTEKSFAQRSFCTQKLYTNKTLTQRSFYRQQLVRKETFTNRNFCTQRTFYTEAFTQKLLHRKPLHREVSTHRSFYIQKHLCKETFVQRSRVELKKMKFAENASIMFIFQKDAGKRRKGNKPIITRICLLSFCFWVLRSPLVF